MGADPARERRSVLLRSAPVPCLWLHHRLIVGIAFGCHNCAISEIRHDHDSDQPEASSLYVLPWCSTNVRTFAGYGSHHGCRSDVDDVLTFGRYATVC
ncbi:Uncharacterised protein [Chlamydia trachomatis]|nr:Uncharacterised protein [Chlamydia trachomatis]